MFPAPQTTRTFFVTSATDGRRALLQSERMARLLMNCLLENRQKGRYLLHEFVVMPNHFHLLITPSPEISLEKALQFIKGGFSYRARKALQVNCAIWQPGFSNHRIRDWRDYEQHRSYIRLNPVQARLSERAEQFPYSSAGGALDLDAVPPWLKPDSLASAFVRGA
jgi:putative transposase